MTEPSGRLNVLVDKFVTFKPTHGWLVKVAWQWMT
jgi:hypothetical protein